MTRPLNCIVRSAATGSERWPRRGIDGRARALRHRFGTETHRASQDR